MKPSPKLKLDNYTGRTFAFRTWKGQEERPPLTVVIEAFSFDDLLTLRVVVAGAKHPYQGVAYNYHFIDDVTKNPALLPVLSHLKEKFAATFPAQAQDTMDGFRVSVDFPSEKALEADVIYRSVIASLHDERDVIRALIKQHESKQLTNMPDFYEREAFRKAVANAIDIAHRAVSDEASPDRPPTADGQVQPLNGQPRPAA